MRPNVNNLNELQKYFEDLVKNKIDLKKLAKQQEGDGGEEEGESQATELQELS